MKTLFVLLLLTLNFNAFADSSDRFLENVKKGWVDDAFAVMEEGQRLNYRRVDEDGMTALHYAILFGLEELALAILKDHPFDDDGVDVNYKNGEYLLLALGQQKWSLADDLLFFKGASVKTRHLEKLLWSCSANSASDYSQGTSVACSSHSNLSSEAKAIARELIVDHGADVNGTTEYGKILLFEAAELDNLDFITILADNGANLNVKNADGNMLLYILSTTPAKLPILKYFANHSRVRKDLRKDDGVTSLMIAAWLGLLENVKILVQSGAKVNLQMPDGRTALQLAQAQGKTQVVDYLKSVGGY